MIKEGSSEESQQFCRHIIGRVAELSQQKCSSNVVEQAIQHAEEGVRDEIIDEIITSPFFRDMLFDEVVEWRFVYE